MNLAVRREFLIAGTVTLRGLAIFCLFLNAHEPLLDGGSHMLAASLFAAMVFRRGSFFDPEARS